jgi:pyruvate/2-oxoglutarate dehydrogenase complex dihydrolipoamide dehydrogenase (E3) component
VAIWLTPDVAYVGLTEREAVRRYGADRVGVSRSEFNLTVKACVEPKVGFIKFVYLLGMF